ncbi:nadh-dependent dehydrogenase : Probable NADH-dependent dehydrogenase OS=Planctomyces maris DSM 8797 GN=PM8797T_19989 PE=4 SV=1: GFO_IDH_MocA [Gemmata massiliana]|uniref:Gfo/Idh/MocA-like oxidoreductase N-terminal domain-containing protein n=1 Tax=Gemmata massiliana TaxID=1210884 RepID=A0A6P2D868_9BACT|nr:Gfo/Idh/MocA family oxidoreductase [Gemmata massiliana]VTR96575.1 nadh-dependent dehydrogenase : Probable NADH-dependent dehydrogenase OS=Planctomyces maris DSM 8797 GN=PM8797T_19989 PE=4 SV=1: GFO_IDH_MocA [Gemmata massiliana]
MSQVTRRSFLRASAAGGTFLALPARTYRSALLADDKPSETVRVACVGVGNQGTGNMKAIRKNVVAVCDVDKGHLASAAKELEKSNTKVATFDDYRKILESKDIDAVLCTTPDHWHALVTIDSCKAGKDVYCEKPLTLVVTEGRAMVKAARDNKRIVQTGSQQRSGKEFRQACELVRNNALGKVKEVKVGLPGPNWVDRAKKPVPDGFAPAALDYDRWLGPAPERPFNANRVHYLFRFFWDYSGGQQTNFGAHDLDITQWALGMDDSGPTTIEGTATFNADKWFETPETAKQTFTYANGVRVHCTLGKGGNPGGVTFECEKGTISVKRGALTVTMNGEKVEKPYELPTGDTKLYVSANHHQNWLDCIKSRKLPICDVEIGHRSATVCHLGNIAIRTGRKITWDAKAETIVGDKDAAAMLTKEYRKPWALS